MPATEVRIGSLFSGAGGLDLAVEQVFGGHTVWHCEVDTAASKVLAHRWPGVPNHSDITAVDWAQVEPVDILCGGFPCQDVSSAGKRAGIREGSRSGLWAMFADVIAALRPPIVIIENVRGLLSATAHRPMESDADAVGDGDSQPVLRAIGAVLGDLSDLGYDAQWATVSAASVGAPHRRERVFILATDAECIGRQRLANDACGRKPDAGRGDLRIQSEGCGSTAARPATDAASDGRHEGWPESARLIGGSDAALGGDGPVELLPTPSVADGQGGHMNRSGDRNSELLLPGIAKENLFGKYAVAIQRWERVTRPAPAPTEPNSKGNPRLAPAFSEWMLGWPAGWVTDVPGISRNDQLRIVGNGVVPQQAEAALHYLLNIAEVAA